MTDWIKTKDKMPPRDDGKWLLFVFEDYIRMGSYERYSSGPYWVDLFQVRYHPDRVHYWMPLPELPIALSESGSQ